MTRATPQSLDMPRGVRLQYTFEPTSQRGADVVNPLFELLQALRQFGSIQSAAKGLGVSYRHAWGALKNWETSLGQPLVTWTQGQPARLTPFAERLLWAETQARARMTPHIEALRAELERVMGEALDGTQQVLTIFASHDMALPLLRERASQAHRLHIDLKFAGSMDALQALAQGRCVVAGFHVPPLTDNHNTFAQGLKPLLQPGVHKLIGCARRNQGLMVARGNPLRLRSLSDVAKSRARFINRQAGSGTRLLIDHLLHQAGLKADAIHNFDGPSEDSHLAVAAAVAAGVGDVAVGLEAAAKAFHLDFVPLIEEEYFLVCLKDALDHPAVQSLCSVLHAPTWAQVLEELPGYERASSGEVLSLTRALPWWTFSGR